MNREKTAKKQEGKPFLGRRGDIEPSLHIMLTAIIAIAFFVLLVYVTKKLFNVKLSFG